MIERSSGILMHISSLSSKYGMGSFGKKAYEFVDFLKNAGQKYWQILPLNPIDGFGSPYKPYSTFAGNSYFIDFDILKEEGILKEEDYSNLDWGKDETLVDFERFVPNRLKVLRIAYDNWKQGKDEEISKFEEENKWARYYACFMFLLEENGWKDFWNWTDCDWKYRNEEAISTLEKTKKDEINFWIFMQIKFYEQWFKLKKYANENGIKIIGDVPFYVSENSADVWSNPEIFSLNSDLSPKYIGGCPPDAFATTGQRWGSPTYNWTKLKETGYYWWIERLRSTFKIYDVVRLDHFRGFDEYYEIDAKEKTAENGKWVKGPGIEFFKKVEEELKDIDFIAEDLGFVTDSVRKLIKDANFPGMRVLEFAFDDWDDEQNAYLPKNFIENCVAYIGTHDNDTAVGWCNNLSFEAKKFVKKELNIKSEEDINWQLIEVVMKSKANLVVFQMQDILGLDENSRMNIPGTVNITPQGFIDWKWRIKSGAITEDLKNKVLDLTKKYNRV